MGSSSIRIAVVDADRSATSLASAQAIVSAPGVLVAEHYVLSNPALNFAQYLLRAVLPTVLHVVVAIASGSAIGSEFSRRSKRAWMRAAGGRPPAPLTSANRLPTRPGIGADGPAADDGGPVHFPDRGLTVRALKKDIGAAAVRS